MEREYKTPDYQRKANKNYSMKPAYVKAQLRYYIKRAKQEGLTFEDVIDLWNN